MAKGNSQQIINVADLDSETQLWVTAVGLRIDLHIELRANLVPLWKDLVYFKFNPSDWSGETVR